MADIEKFDRIYGVSKPESDTGLTESGSIAFLSATASITAELKTSGISVLADTYHPDNLHLLVVEKPGDKMAGDLTIKTYNCIKVDGTTERDVLLTTHTISSTTTGTFGASAFLIQGLGIGDGSIKLSMNWAGETSGLLTTYYKIYRI